MKCRPFLNLAKGILTSLVMGCGSLSVPFSNSVADKKPESPRSKKISVAIPGALSKRKSNLKSKSLGLGKSTLSPTTSREFALNEKEKAFIELSGEKINSMSDPQIYKKVLDSYRESDLIGVENFGDFLLRRNPKSIYGDNVLYLKGMLYFNQKKFGDSLSAFQKILDDYPKSNKAVSALFAKGIVFRKMNLDKVAIKMLAKVINDYPGTPESQRAQSELSSMTQ